MFATSGMCLVIVTIIITITITSNGAVITMSIMSCNA